MIKKHLAILVCILLFAGFVDRRVRAANENQTPASRYRGAVKTVETEEALFTKKIKLPMTQTTLEQFDEQARLIEMHVKLNGLQTRHETYSYNEQNQLREIVRYDEWDSVESAIINEYDDDFRLIGQTLRDASGDTRLELSFEYDEQGRLRRRVEKGGATYVHDWKIDRGGSIETVSLLDDKGEKIKTRCVERDPQGLVLVEIEYDADGLETVAKKTTYTYDEHGTAVKITMEDKMQNSAVETEFDPTYDEHGNWVALAKNEMRAGGEKIRLFETVLTRSITYYDE